MPADDVYDLVALGGGPGGGTAAAQVARRGGRACIVEMAHLGGACLNLGCMPAKAMLAASDVCWRMRSCRPLGIAPVRPQVDAAAFMRRVAEVVATLRQRSERAAASHKLIDVIRGRGRLIDARSVSVQTPEGERRISGKAVVIATGTSPSRPGFLPWGSPRVMTTDDATTAADLPDSVLVMGGGVIGCEFATVYAELGIPTTLVEMLDSLLPGLDGEAAAAVARSLADRGADVITGHGVAEMTDCKAGIAARLDDGREVRAARALVAVGRRANLEGLGLEAVAVRVEDGVIAVDDRCRTNVEGVYAVGDVAEKRQYAHLAERMGTVAGENAMGFELRDDRRVVPVGVYTHPEVASVGLTLEEARRQSGSACVLRYNYAHSGTALAYGRTEGQLKVVADPDSGHVHGALWIGPHAVDMIQEFALAMRHGLTMEQLYHTIHPHPTFQEAASVVAEAWMSQALRRRS